MNRGSSRLLSVLVLLALPDVAAIADESWLRWGGPRGNFHVRGSKLADTWPVGGPRQLWKRQLGDGYSSIVVKNGRLYTMFRRDGREHVVALAAATGKTVWRHGYAISVIAGTDVEQFGPGPLATPLIAGKRLCAVGVTGVLHCLDLEKGSVLWRRDLIRKLQGTSLYRGYSASPIVYGESVIVPVGGQGRAVVALSLEDGSILWKTQDFAISHVSPLLIRFAERDQLVVVGEKVIVGLDPSSGALLWTHPHPIKGGYISSTPVWGADGRLIFSGAYGAGSRCLELRREGDVTVPREVWHNSRLRVHHSNVIRQEDHVYGPSGDFGAIVYTALDVKTGKVAWQDRRLGRAACLLADGKFVVLDEDGQLMLAEMSPVGLKILATAAVFESRSWTVPTLVGRRLFVRNRKAIVAMELP